MLESRNHPPRQAGRSLTEAGWFLSSLNVPRALPSGSARLNRRSNARYHRGSRRGPDGNPHRRSDLQSERGRSRRVPLDNPLVSLGQPSAYSRKSAPLQFRLYIDLFNNQWTTNFAFGTRAPGPPREIWAFDRFDAASCLTTPSLEAASTRFRRRWPRGPRRFSARQAGPEISAPRGTLLTPLVSDAEQTARVLRLWELAGVDGPCKTVGCRPLGTWACAASEPHRRRQAHRSPCLTVVLR